MNNSNFSVLLVDDDQDVLDAYAHLMSISNLSAKTISDPTLAAQYLDCDWPGVVILDMYMPQMHGMELLQKIKTIDEKIPVIIITGHGDIPMAVDAVRKGACEFLEKPVNPAELLTFVKQNLSKRCAYIEQKKNVSKTIQRALIGKSAQMEQIRDYVAQYALLNTHVVVCGEPGSGRHSISYLIHQMTHQNKSANVYELIVNRDIELDTLEQALAKSCNGTLIVNGLELMAENIQRHFIQMLLNQERQNNTRTRVIAVFSEDPESLIANNHLQPELYYLLNQGMITIPSLRHRPDDIAAIFHYFLKQSCSKLSKTMPVVDNSYLALLRAHQWPGNVRELRNVAELYAIGIVKLTGKERLYNQAEIQSPLDELVGDYEKQIIEDALFLHSGKVLDAAKYLQIPRKKLYLRMKKHNIEKDDYKSKH